MKRILYKHELHDISRLAGAIRGVIEGFLVARSAALPSPDRPKRGGDDEESQDQYGGFDFDFDLNDPALVAALDGSTEPQAGPDLKAKQAALQPVRFCLIYCHNFPYGHVACRKTGVVLFPVFEENSSEQRK